MLRPAGATVEVVLMNDPRVDGAPQPSADRSADPAADRDPARPIGIDDERARLQSQLTRRLDLHRLLNEVAGQVNELTGETYIAGLERLLEQLGTQLRARRAQIWRTEQTAGPSRLLAEWVIDGAKRTPPELHVLEPDTFDTIASLQQIVEPIRIPMARVSPDLSTHFVGTAIILAPAVSKGRQVMSLVMEDSDHDEWSDAELDLIQSVISLVAQCHTRVEAEDRLLRRLDLEDLVRSIATRFLQATTADMATTTTGALRRLTEVLGVDRASIWDIDHDRRHCRLASTWPALEVDSVHPVGIDSSPALEHLTRLDVTIARTFAADAMPLTTAVGGRDAVSMYVPVIGATGVSHTLVGFQRRDQQPWADEEASTLEALASLLVQLSARVSAEEQFAAAFEHAPVGITLRSQTGRLLACNPAYEQLVGRTESELIGTPRSAVVAPGEPGTQQAAESDGDPRLAEHSTRELKYLRPDGSPVWGRIRSVPIQSAPDGTAIVLSHVEDITEARKAVEQLEFRASHDDLTGLANRTAFISALTACTDQPVAVLMVDLDRFKIANDSLGHSAGDEILRTIADRLRFAIRPGDVAARLGGDEFIVMLRGPVTTAEASVVAARLLELIAQPIDIGQNRVATTASVGIATPTEGNVDVEDLVRHADAAMYIAKAKGRNRFEIFDQRQRDALATRLRTEADLRAAVETRQLAVHYQPEVDLETGRLLGVEGLVRWPHPELGILTAGAFIGVAEHTGLIVDLGRFVFEQVCIQAAAWNQGRAEPLTCRVNVSPRQLERREFVSEVRSALTAHDIDPGLLCLEITETALMTDVGESMTLLRRLKALGVRLAIDDFGTGFSSLAYLKRFPVDVLKIDQAFVRGLGTDRDDEAIVRSIIDMAAALDLEVVAEGIETAQQRDYLVGLGCVRGQGFGLFRPAPPADLGGLVASGALQLDQLSA